MERVEQPLEKEAWEDRRIQEEYPIARLDTQPKNVKVGVVEHEKKHTPTRRIGDKSLGIMRPTKTIDMVRIERVGRHPMERAIEPPSRPDPWYKRHQRKQKASVRQQESF